MRDKNLLEHVDKKYTYASVFDLDHTLITSNCSLDFCRYLVLKKVLPRAAIFYSALYYFQHVFLTLSLSELHERVFARFLKGCSIEILEDHADAFVKQYLHRALYIPAICQLKLAQHLGHYTVIVSNSPSFLVKKIAFALAVDRYKATEYAVDKEQQLCHISSIMQGEEKASYILKIAQDLGIDTKNITAYSDSMWDLPLLLAVGKAVAVRPDRKLRSYSQARTWTIL